MTAINDLLGNNLKNIKRASVGSYVKADVTGSGNWEAGIITKFDSKKVWFESALDGSEVWVDRTIAYKSSPKELKQFKEMLDAIPKEYDNRTAASRLNSKERAKRIEERAKKKGKEVKKGATCKACGADLVFRLPEPEERGTHQCEGCGHFHYIANKNVVNNSKNARKLYSQVYNKVKQETGYTDTGDEVAVLLRDIDLDILFEVAGKINEAARETATERKAKNMLSADELRVKYAHLNHGMQRMNLGNRLRAFINSGTLAGCDVKAIIDFETQRKTAGQS